MKKVFLTLAIVLGVATAANAQDAGRMWVGGTAGVWSSKVQGGDSQLSFKVMPEFGYILSENIGVGIALGAAHTHGGLKFDEETLSGKGAQNIYTINPFLRYTFLKGDIGALFFDAGVAYGIGKIVDGGDRLDKLEVGFRPGVAVNISNNIALIGKFGFLGWQYDHTKPSVGPKSHSNSFGLDLDMSNVQLGVSLKF